MKGLMGGNIFWKRGDNDLTYMSSSFLIFFFFMRGFHCTYFSFVIIICDGHRSKQDGDQPP